MKKLFAFTPSALVLLAIPLVAGAQNNVTTLVQDFIAILNDAVIPLILALAFVVFVWGMFRYYIFGASDEGARENGKNLMIYGLIAFFVIVSLWGIINLLTGSFNLTGETLDNVPDIRGL